MVKTLYQNRNFTSKKFTLDDQYLTVEDKSWTEEKSWKIRLDKIGNQKYFLKESKKPKIVALVIFGTIFLFTTLGYIFFNEHTADSKTTMIVVDIFFGLFLLYFSIKKLKNELTLIGGEQNVTFFNDLKNEKELNEFIDHLIKSANIYIRNKYCKIDLDLPEERQMAIFHWLKDREIINEKEYEKLKQEYRTQKII